MKGICPVCGKDNGCAMLKGEDPKSCWCMTIQVPKELLNQVAPEERGKSCICKNCVMEFKENHE